MLGDGFVMAMVAVSDAEAGRSFYGDTLGLKQLTEIPAGTIFEVGGGQLAVYAAESAGTGESTAAAFVVEDVDATVEELKAKGIAFERYEMPGVDASSDVHTMDVGDGKIMKAAWFKDPDGNIIGINNAP